MTFMSDALRWNADVLTEHASVPIEYRRDGQLCHATPTIQAVPGQMSYEAVGENVVEASLREEWYIEAAELELNGQPIEPQRQDTITHTARAKDSFLVMGEDSLPVWEYTDNYQRRMLIRTVRTKRE